jgi:hypothetical protein
MEVSKMKRHMISFFVLLFLIIISVTFFIVLINNDKKAREENADTSGKQVTIVPTQEVTPSVAPTPTVPAEKNAELYPAYKLVDNVKTFGYINKSGNFVIEPTFSMASDFHEGAAVVVLNNEYGVIDENGNILFINKAPINDFRNGAAIFQVTAQDTTLYGYIDTKGKVIVEAKYTMASDFCKDNTAYVYNGDGKYDLIDKEGKVLESYTVDKKYDKYWSLGDGYLIYSDADFGNYGVISVNGDKILKPVYSQIRYLGNDLFAVKEPGIEDYSQMMAAKEAIFNKAGEQLTDYEYYDVADYYNGYSSATDDTSTFFLGMDGKKVSDLPEYDGRGTLQLFGDVIKADIDRQLIYSTTDKLILWQNDNTVTLSDTITVKELRFKPNRDVLVIYPEVDGLADPAIQDSINLALKGIFTDARKDLTLANQTTVDDSFSAKLLKNLLIIERDGYDYPYGAAHGMPIMDFFYIDIRTGVFYQLKDLFIEGSDYAAKINEMITDEINTQIAADQSSFFPDTFLGIAKDQFFKLDKDSISIYFYPYDIAPYAAGFPEFLIPFSDIIDYIDRDGAFWNSFNGTN